MLFGCVDLAALTSGDSADAHTGDGAAAGDSGREADAIRHDSAHDFDSAADAVGDATNQAPTLRQSQTVTISASSAIVTIMLPSAGLKTDTLILPIANYSGNDSVSSITGGGGTWMKAAGPEIIQNATGTAEIWYAPNISPGERVVTITFAQTLMTTPVGSSGVATLTEWQGLRAAPFDKSAQNEGAGTTSFSSPPITPSLPNQLFIAVATTQRYGASLASGAWTELGQFSAMSEGYSDAVYLVASSSDAEAASGTQGTGPGDSWVIVLATFKP
jgi:hypothetical protein